MNVPSRARLTTFKHASVPQGKKSRACPVCQAPKGHSCIRYMGKTKEWPGYPVLLKTFHKER